ncbi:MAG TPA: permease, partial [Gemmataceae bacterium]
MNYEQLVKDFILFFTSILYEAMPFIILGAVIAGILEELVPQQLIARVIPKNRKLAIALSALLGLIFPMCECGIVPVMRRLLRKGLPLGCCAAYLLAGPIINPIVIISTAVAFQHGDATTWRDGRGPIMVVFRVVGGYIVAVITALIVERQFRKHGYDLLTPLARPDNTPLPRSKPDEPVPEATESESPAEAHEEEREHTHERPTAWKRLSNISETALHDFVDITVFLILGALLAAGTRMVVTPRDIGQWSDNSPLLAILVMMALAIILCLCSEADAFVAASFTTMHPAA